MKQDLLGLKDLSADEIMNILNTAQQLKNLFDTAKEKSAAFAGKDGNKSIL